MAWIETSEEAALDAAVPLVEWADKIEVSMPAFFSWSFIHRPTVELVTALCGFVEPIRSSFALWGLWRPLVLSIYDCKQVSGQIALFWLHSQREKRISGPERWDFRRVPRLNETLGPANSIVSVWMDVISPLLKKVVKASRETNLRESCKRNRVFPAVTSKWEKTIDGSHACSALLGCCWFCLEYILHQSDD